MENKSFAVTIEVLQSPQDVFKRLTQDVAKWWGGPDLTGSTQKLNDEFTIQHPGAHYSKQKIETLIPNEKLIWLVTESTLDWLQKDKQEWENTKMIFELSIKGGQTVLQFTHEGLVPEKECYLLCRDGWNTVIKNYLFFLITEDRSQF